MPNYYKTSNGGKVSQATINRRRSEAYKSFYHYTPVCEGCGKVRAQGSAHLIPQMRCKHLNKTELIWDLTNIVPTCHKCNSVLESYKSEEVKKLLCYNVLLEFTATHDPERYQKMI